LVTARAESPPLRLNPHFGVDLPRCRSGFSEVLAPPKDTGSGRNAGCRADLVALPRPPHAIHAAARSGHFASGAEAE
jgi:hypothetical protein